MRKKERRKKQAKSNKQQGKATQHTQQYSYYALVIDHDPHVDLHCEGVLDLMWEGHMHDHYNFITKYVVL